MDLAHDLNDVVKSLQTKLSQAELRSSQFEAVIIAKDNKIKELEKEFNNQIEKLSTEKEQAEKELELFGKENVNNG